MEPAEKKDEGDGKKALAHNSATAMVVLKMRSLPAGGKRQEDSTLWPTALSGAPRVPVPVPGDRAYALAAGWL
jgi:hypothetical protein